jgi:hypothetical protein
MLKFRLSLILVCLICSVASGYDFYVSSTGSDRNPGSKTQPVYSLARAGERAVKLIEGRGYT